MASVQTLNGFVACKFLKRDSIIRVPSEWPWQPMAFSACMADQHAKHSDWLPVSLIVGGACGACNAWLAAGCNARTNRSVRVPDRALVIHKARRYRFSIVLGPDLPCFDFVPVAPRKTGAHALLLTPWPCPAATSPLSAWLVLEHALRVATTPSTGSATRAADRGPTVQLILGHSIGCRGFCRTVPSPVMLRCDVVPGRVLRC